MPLSLREYTCMSTNAFVCMLCVPVCVSGLVPFKNSFKIFIYLFLAGLGLHCLKSFSLVVASGPTLLLQCSGFLWLLFLQSPGSSMRGLQ